MTEYDISTDLDGESLAAHLTDRLGPATALHVHPLEGGNSNETLLVEWGEQTFVLRRPPARQPVPDLLHDVTREFEVLTGLRGTAVPAPEPVLCCRDESVLGAPFYLMDLVPGSVLGGEEPDRFANPNRRRKVGEEIIDGLVALHALERETVGPAAADDPPDLEAAVAAHTDRLDRALARTAAERPLPRARAVGGWLAANVPDPTETVVVHGDYKPDNMLFGPATEPTLAAILDWEMAGAGDPLVDLGWFLAYWADPGDPDAIDDTFESRFGDHEMYPAVEEYVGDHAGFMTNEGYHTRQELVQRYESRTGREYGHDRFYRALALYKLIAICEAFYAHYLDDPAQTKPTYPLMAVLVPAIAARAKLIVDGESPL